MVFAGDEIGLEGVLGEDARRPMPWHRPGSWDRETMATYTSLAGLRRSHAALRWGGQRWVHVSANALAFVREHESGDLLVVACRGGSRSVTVPAAALGCTDGTALLSTSGAATRLRRSGRGRDATVEIPLQGKDLSVYAL
jgi:alpha-glucosidase